MSTLEERIVATIRDRGAMPFHLFVELALYDETHGFYATAGRAGGRSGDFITSVEVGPLFAAVIGDWLDRRWTESGSPDEFLVSEVGAGVGTLFRGIERAEPACADALVYTLVERSAELRLAHESLPGDQWQSESELPEKRQHVVLANELLDNLAFDIAERVPDGWALVTVGLDDGGSLEMTADVADTNLGFLGELAPNAPMGCRVPVTTTAAEWVETARSRADCVLVFDYAAATAELAVRGHAGWLRTYGGHVRGSNPLEQIGLLDITHDVPFDQLPPTTGLAPQRDWLRAQGIDRRVQDARTAWAERGHIGDLEALAARSAVNEAEALLDAGGLGAFVAMEWS